MTVDKASEMGSCSHDVYARYGQGDDFEEAFRWNRENLVVKRCREHDVWIEVPREWRSPVAPRRPRLDDGREAACPTCGRVVRVRSSGEVRNHRAQPPSGQPWSEELCAGGTP